MDNQTTYPVEGFNHLIIAEMSRDALVRGSADAATLQVFHAGGEPALQIEGTTAHLANVSVERIFVPADLAVTVVRASGDLRISGLSGNINLETVYGGLRLTEMGGATSITDAFGDLRIEDIADLRLLGTCEGDLRCERAGALSVKSIAGDLRLSNVREASVTHVHGNLWVEKLAGALTVTRGDGDARISEVGGPVALQALQGDLRANGLTAGLAAQVSGDVALHGPFADAEYALAAEGDVALHLPSEANVRLVIRAGGRIRSDPRLTPAADGSPTFTAVLGHGAGRITLNVNGDLRIAQAGAPAVFDSKVSRSGWDKRGRVSADELDSLRERIREQVTSTLASAGINMETGEINLGPRGPRGPKSARPPEPPRPPELPRPPERSRQPDATAAPPAEEQLAILKMLESGTITAVEAETLLKALGG